MNDVFKWVGKFFLHMILWVFVLSIRWDGKTLFSYAHETFVQNEIVATLDEELADVWYRLKETAKVTFTDAKKDDQEAM